ncbi:hypothetical protein [Clostridium sp.]|jgi:hypothetical protein|uniref:hypothetical protein n=1 Tax=Clostridium sp. TaxID=1506 RepID=UPI00258EEFAC|nr:hypothetical protein [Clostridium sp.]MDF2503074.1 regulatory protein LuxR [Clostridium sp.]
MKGMINMLVQKLDIQAEPKDDFDLFLDSILEYENENEIGTVAKELHKDSQGYIASCQKNGKKWEQKCFKVNDLEIEEENGYFSLNTFYQKWRNKDLLFEYTSLYVELDTYSLGLKKEEVFNTLEQNVFGKVLPYPTWLISKGNGLYCIWKFKKSVPARNKEGFNHKVAKLWDAAQEYIFNTLEVYGADSKSKNACYVFRADNTFNIKYKKEFDKVTILKNFKNEITLDEFRKTWMPEYNTKANLNKRGKSIKELNYTRISDIESLVKMRTGKCTGITSYLLLLYSYHKFLTSNDVEKTTSDTYSLNSLFTDPENNDKVESIIKNSYKAYEEWFTEKKVEVNGKKCRKGYNYTNENIIKMLNITIEEQKQLKTLKCKEIVRENKNNKRKEQRRNENGLTSREQQKQDNINKVKEMKSKGINNTLIAGTLGLSRQIVSKYANMQ